MKKGTAYIIGNNPAMHELLQPLLFQAGYRWDCGAKYATFIEEQILFACEDDMTLYTHPLPYDFNAYKDYDIVNLTGWTLWNHPDDKQPKDDNECSFMEASGIYGLGYKTHHAWLASSQKPTLEMMNIGRKPKLTPERRKEIEAEKEELKIRLVKLEKELEG